MNRPAPRSKNQLLIDQGDQIGQDYLAELRDKAIIVRY